MPDKILKARKSLYYLLMRGESQKLRGAVLGLDFDKDSTADGSYCPAHVRYARGQFMTSLEGELEETLDLWFDANRLFFLSGLYGIVGASEPIQNYDVELAEKAADHWEKNRNSLTEFLLGSLEKGSTLLDCCGDMRYSSLVDWEKIEENDHTVLHAIDRQREGGQVRAEAGVLAAKINDETIKRMESGEKIPGLNADIEFVSSNEFHQPHTGLSGHLPWVGVINTDLNEFSVVTVEAERRGWDKHFRFKLIGTPEALERAYQDGVKQCICLIPSRSHRFLVDWCGGRQPQDVFRGELLKVHRPIKLVLRFSNRS